MAIGTGFDAKLSFAGITGVTGAYRARLISGPSGRGHEPIDFSDLEDTPYENILPGDRSPPGSYEVTFLYDPDNPAGAGRMTAEQFILLVLAKDAGQTMVITHQGRTETATGFVSDSVGANRETNTPMEFSITWQVQGAVVYV